jgi:hypothetical protein
MTGSKDTADFRVEDFGPKGASQLKSKFIGQQPGVDFLLGSLKSVLLSVMACSQHGLKVIKSRLQVGCQLNPKFWEQGLTEFNQI